MNTKAKFEKSSNKPETKQGEKNSTNEKRHAPRENKDFSPLRNMKSEKLEGSMDNKWLEQEKGAESHLKELPQAIKQLESGRKELGEPLAKLPGSKKELTGVSGQLADNRKELPAGMMQLPNGEKVLPSAPKEVLTSAEQLANAIKQLKSARKELPGFSGQLTSGTKQLSDENIKDTKMNNKQGADLNSVSNGRKQLQTFTDNIKKKEYLNPGLLSTGEDADASLQVAIKNFKISTNEDDIVSKELLEYKQTKWKDVGLSAKLINILLSLGYEFPSPVQYQSIPAIIKGKDVLVRAKNGSGKSLSFLIPIIQRIDPEEQSLQAIVVAPTRELALQIARFARSLCKDLGIKSCPLIGGSNITDDMLRVSSGVQLLIGAPGRLYSVLSRKMCSVGNNPLVVFDEADKLLDSVFYEQISKLLDVLPRKRQMCLFSATFPQSAKTFINANMKTPELIKTSNEYTLFNIAQFYCFVTLPTKLPCLKSLLTALDINQCIIYVNSIKHCQPLAKKITEMGYSCYFIHSKLSQDERNLILHNFAKNKTKILVSSDITTRGTDVQGVNIVINFDLPKSSESYLHRLGRAGRFGTRGCCISMISEDEIQAIQSYATFVGAPIIACKGGDLKKFCKD